MAAPPRNVQSEDPISEFEVRLGNKLGPPHEDGRRGIVAFKGPMPQSARPWLAGLTAMPLSERHGAAWLYFDGELISTRPGGERVADDPDEVRARQVLIDIDASEADVADKNRLRERLEVKLQALAERAQLEQRRVDLLVKEEGELAARIAAQRERVAKEEEQLDQQLTQARRNATTMKAQLQQEQLDFAKTMTSLQDQVAEAFREQRKKTIEEAQTLTLHESAILQSAAGRKTDAVAAATSVVDLMAKVEAGALNSLLPSGPKPPGAGEKLANEVGGWLFQGGGMNQIAGGLGKIVNFYMNPHKPKP